MKNIKTMSIVVALICLFATKGHAQDKATYPFYDALKLKEIFNRNNNLSPDDVAEASAILANYVSNPSDDQRIKAQLSSNPFLPESYTGYAFMSESVEVTANSSLANRIGGLDVSNIVDGISKFIVARTKKELQAAFFDRFTEQIKSDEYKDIRILFPQTYNVVLSLPEKVYSYEPFLESLREAFGKDLINILPHLEEVLKNGSHVTVKFFTEHKELKSMCLTALYFGNKLKLGKHVGQVLEDYDTMSPNYDFSDVKADAIKDNAIIFIQEVSKSIKTKEPGEEYWVPVAYIRTMVEDPVFFKLYLALLYEKVKDLEVSPGELKYGKALETLYTNGETIQSFINQIASGVASCQALVATISAKPYAERTVADYFDYFNASLNVLETFNNKALVDSISDQFKKGTADNEKKSYDDFWNSYEKIREGSRAFLSIYTAIYQKDYSLAISNVRVLYNLRYQAYGAPESVNKVSSFLLDKGTLIAGVAQAKTSDDVHKAIEKAAMPEGSSRIKRLSETNIAVNAYCGLFAGKEKIHNAPEDNKFINTYGLTVPIGISFSKGDRILPWPIHGVFKAKGFSSTIFLSVIDIGAVAAYRFSNETAEEVPDVQLKDIFSPGLFWSVGLPKLPLSINIGAQVGPNLRKVNVGSVPAGSPPGTPVPLTNDYSGSTYIRYSLSVCVDIPLFNLFTR